MSARVRVKFVLYCCYAISEKGKSERWCERSRTSKAKLRYPDEDNTQPRMTVGAKKNIEAKKDFVFFSDAGKCVVNINTFIALINRRA